MTAPVPVSSMITATFNALVVGAGAIGACYDSPGSDNVLTHAHAFSVHPGFRLAGFVDKDPEQLARAVCTWGGKGYPTVADACRDQDVDIVSIAVPDDLHYPLLLEVSGLPLKAVFTEKPLTRTLQQAEEVRSIYAERAIALCVNYRRSFVPEFESLRNEIKSGSFGEYLTGSGYYGKGFLHSGSHLVHLLSFLLDEVSCERVLASEADFYPEDPSISAILAIRESGKFFMHHVPCHHFTIFEVDLFFERCRVRITDTGLSVEYQETGQSSMFPGYTFLLEPRKQGTLLNRSLYYSASNIYNHIVHDEPLKCTLQDAYHTMFLCDGIMSLAAGGLPV